MTSDADRPADPAPHLPPVDAAAVRVPSDTLSPELLAGLLADGDDELAAWTLTHALHDDARAEVYDGLLADAMALVGERWSTGQWSVAEEHLASQTLLRALDRIRPPDGPASRVGPLAILAGVAGEQHMIGLVCLSHVLREGGWTVANLGADVPTADLARFVERNAAELVALSASDPERAPTLVEAVQAVRDAAARRHDRPIAVMLGGRLANHPGFESAVGADWSGRSLVDAARFAAARLATATADDT
ncbi:MAG TPA: cobalamin-dependent protein [Candidatus Saccharimonadales bacterium]|nr:cobalamin-dependent protein [Candidatus Saccharimonadales bacterium]